MRFGSPEAVGIPREYDWQQNSNRAARFGGEKRHRLTVLLVCQVITLTSGGVNAETCPSACRGISH